MYKGDGETVCLSSGEWKAVIRPDFGMNAVSITYKGREILRKPKDFQTLIDNPYVYGIPLLFPANRTKGGAFEYMGRKHTLPLNEPEKGNHIHGLMYNAPFCVVKRTQNCVEAKYENKCERYPFAFVMTIRDALSKDGFHRMLEIKNTGNTPFPYTIAFHASFSEPEKMIVPVKERFLCDENHIPTGERALLTETEKRYQEGISLKNLPLTGFFSSGGTKAYLDDIAFTVSENFDEWILFNAGGGKGFVCVEPQAGEVNGLNTSGGYRILNDGETHVFTLSITREENV